MISFNVPPCGPNSFRYIKEAVFRRHTCCLLYTSVSTDPGDFIYKRAFGQAAGETAGYVAEVVRQMNESGIGCTLKHFPGYGSNVDTHTGIAHDTREYDAFLNSDFLPFSAGIKEKIGRAHV